MKKSFISFWSNLALLSFILLVPLNSIAQPKYLSRAAENLHYFFSSPSGVDKLTGSNHADLLYEKSAHIVDESYFDAFNSGMYIPVCNSPTSLILLNHYLIHSLICNGLRGKVMG